MRNGKIGLATAIALGAVAWAPAALAQSHGVVITGPQQSTTNEVVYQPAAPTRLFSVEKAATLAPGDNRFGANLQVGGLGMAGAAPGIAGGVNLRADMGMSPGFETGLSITGLGGGGASNLLGNINLRGKMALTNLSIGAVPVAVGGLANVGALATGSGLGQASIAVGIPLTAALTPSLNVTLAPGLGFGVAAGGFLPGGASPTVGAAGFTPALGLGLDIGLTDRLSAMIDGNMGFTGAFGASGNLGVRYGITDDLAADLFFNYSGSPLTAVNTGTVGVGGYYAF